MAGNLTVGYEPGPPKHEASVLIYIR